MYKGNNSTQVTALRRIHFNFLSNLLKQHKITVQKFILPYVYPKC